ncbi:hypothetical protein [Mesomycoplasma neurolyticum]|uniref:Uncharacterized protein n=1 Tax=Mesomycoplasma neurolyticum TaxID=2120 RepID=A0A449A594_9BACT|nr:hypothetical protein [Mesomycoplasma neurolyticum]VEU59408.1 Uncharacterised protein [Mesomycoplasma neurolyticum]
MNNKFLIERKIFYFKIILLSIYVIFLSFWILDIVVFGTKQYDGLTPSTFDEKIRKFLTIKIFVFVFNYLVIIFYLFNLIFVKNKGFGYFFAILWLILFAAIFTSNLINKDFYDNTFRLVLIIVMNLILAIIVLTFIYFVFKIYQLKMLNKVIKYKL